MSLQVEVSVLIANATQGDAIAFHSLLRRLEKSKATLLWEANLCQARVCCFPRAHTPHHPMTVPVAIKTASLSFSTWRCVSIHNYFMLPLVLYCAVVIDVVMDACYVHLCQCCLWRNWL